MKLIVGLGNPGPQYANTRHNLGRRVIEAFRNAGWEPPRGSATLETPETFMNKSGGAVKKLVKSNRIEPDSLLVVHDDADLVFGKMRLSYGSRSAGHRGVESVIKALKTKNFWRLRLGIRPPTETVRKKADELILEPFMADENQALAGTIIPHAIEIIRAWIEHTPMP